MQHEQKKVASQLRTTRSKPIIAVCICTYKRNSLLEQLIQSLKKLNTDGSFTYRIIVIDNDSFRGAQSIVEKHMSDSPVPIFYDCEPEQNIALTRNRAVRNAKKDADYLAFIDDDEIPETDWLILMYNTLSNYNAKAVFAPVKPKFEQPPPSWLRKGNLLDRVSFPTGTQIKSTLHTRTGNVLMNMCLLEDLSPFNPVYGKSGGEDVDFFRRKLTTGCIFVWCNESVVYEHVPPERMTRKYLLVRALLRGVVAGKRQNFTIRGFTKSITAIAIYTTFLPFLLVMGHHHFMRTLIRFCDHAGKLLTWIGIPPVKTRSF